MDRSPLSKLNLILEKLRSDHGEIDRFSKSIFMGLEDLSEENITLAHKLANRDDRLAMLTNEMSVYYVASVEAQGRCDGAFQANSQLQAELQGFKNSNVQLVQHYAEARGQVVDLSTQLDAAHDDIDGLRLQIEKLKKFILDRFSGPPPSPEALNLAAESFRPLDVDASTINIGDPPLTPPLVTEGIYGLSLPPGGSQAISLSSSGGENKRSILGPISNNRTVLSETPVINRAKASGATSVRAQDAATSHPKAKGITRGGPLVDESFARIKRNLALANKNNLLPPSDASNDPRASSSLRDFSWPLATLIQDVKKTLNPECVPFVSPAAKSKTVSKLNPLSQVFVPSTSQSERRITPPHKRVPKVDPKAENLPSKQTTETVNMGSKPSQPFPSELQEPHSNSSEAEDVSAKVKDDVTAIKNEKKILPHLRCLPPKAATPTLPPAAALETATDKEPSLPVTAGALMQSTSVMQSEAETMRAWLDDLEKQSTSQSLQDERSNSTHTSLSGNKLISLDAEDAGKSSAADFAPGFTVEAMHHLLEEAKNASPTLNTASPTADSLLATLQTLPAKAHDGSNVTAILKDLLAQFQTPQNVPANVQQCQRGLDNERYTTATSTDPYLQHVSREPIVANFEITTKTKKEQSSFGSFFDQPAVSEREVDNNATSKDGFADGKVVDERVSKFRSKLPATEDESNITADFLTAYDSKFHDVQGKYGKAAKSEEISRDKGSQAEKSAPYDPEQYFDPGYIAPKIVGTHKLGELLDLDTKFMIMNDTPDSSGEDMEIKLDWKPVVKGGKTVFVL